MKTENVLQWGLIGLGAYLAYQALNKFKTDVTDPLAKAMADFWVSLATGPPMRVQGDIIIDGQDIGALADADVRTDAQGSVYIKTTDGTVWQLGQSDSHGNWPATRVLAKDFGVSNPNSWDG